MQLYSVILVCFNAQLVTEMTLIVTNFRFTVSLIDRLFIFWINGLNN